MGRKVFISYKYGDRMVQYLGGTPMGKQTTVRNYVDEIQDRFKNRGTHINKGELDGEDLSQFKNSTIESKLRNKIYDSSVTIVLISPNMKDLYKPEEDQWIPWEIAYSLRETTRNNRTSRRNGILAVVLPDIKGRYDYVLEKKWCCERRCTTYDTSNLFKVIRENMFNKRNLSRLYCKEGQNIYEYDSSYIVMIRWIDFIENMDYWIDKAIEIRDDMDSYDIHINVY